MILVAIGATATTHAFVTGDDDSTGVRFRNFALRFRSLTRSRTGCLGYAEHLSLCLVLLHRCLYVKALKLISSHSERRLRCLCRAALLQRQSLRATLDGEPSTRGFNHMNRSYHRRQTSLGDALNHISETAAWRGDVVQLGSARQDWEEEDTKEKVAPPLRHPPSASLPSLFKQHNRSLSSSRASRSCAGVRETVSALARPCSRVWRRNVSFASSGQTSAKRHFAVESITVSVKVEQQVEREDEEDRQEEV